MNLGKEIFEIGGLFVVLLATATIFISWYRYHRKKESIPRNYLVIGTLIVCLVLMLLALLAYDNVAAVLIFGIIFTLAGAIAIFLLSTVVIKLDSLKKKHNSEGVE